MIRATENIDGPLFTFRATVRGLAIYLDNWAIYDLAEGDHSRRDRFVAAVCSGAADLMFSVANAAELSGPQGKSFDDVKSFLNEIGPNWFPIELDVFAVVEREKNGADPAKNCVSEEFMKAYFVNRTANSSDPGKDINLSEAFSGLGAVLNWLGPQRDSIRKRSREFDDVLKKAICKVRPKYKQNPLPPLPFDPSRPATFTAINLVRTLIAESNQLKKNDGLDFCHAVMANSFASVAALDGPWKRRVESLPKTKKLAHIYSRPELDKMVTDIESCLRQGGYLR